MKTIKLIKQDEITITKPAEDVILTREEINSRILMLELSINNLQESLNRQNEELLYYNDLINQMPLPGKNK